MLYLDFLKKLSVINIFRLLASSSKDGDVKIWDTVLSTTVLTISGHIKCVTVVKWGGNGLIYTASQDRTVKVWRASDGILCRTLEGHAHWVNTLALSTDYILRIGKRIKSQFQLFFSL